MSLRTPILNYADMKVLVEAVGEGTAATNMITDVEGGADIFGFAQDQLARLVASGALIDVSEENAALVTAENDGGSVAAVTLGRRNVRLSHDQRQRIFHVLRFQRDH